MRLTKLEKLGSGPPLEPRRVTGAELQEPGPDCEWVELRAVVKATSVDKFGGLYFSLLTDGWHFTAYVSRMEKFKTPPWEFFERRVRVHAWSARTSTRSGRCAGAG